MRCVIYGEEKRTQPTRYFVPIIAPWKSIKDHITIYNLDNKTKNLGLIIECTNRAFERIKTIKIGSEVEKYLKFIHSNLELAYRHIYKYRKL